MKEQRIYGICKLPFVRRRYRCLRNSASNDVFPLAIHADISLFNHVWDKKYGSRWPRRRAAHLDAELGRRSGSEIQFFFFPFQADLSYFCVEVNLCDTAPGPSLSARHPHPCRSGLEPCSVEDLLHPRPDSPAGSQSAPELTFKPSGPQWPRRPLLNPDEPPPLRCRPHYSGY